MISRVRVIFVVVILVLLHVSCARLAEEQPPKEGEIVMEELPHADSIPLKWGKLISVSSAADINWVQLWFQDEESNIRMVLYNIRNNTLSKKARLFSRK
jgi:hypothetical protein